MTLSDTLTFDFLLDDKYSKSLKYNLLKFRTYGKTNWNY